jgi:hypothetical protein
LDIAEQNSPAVWIERELHRQVDAVLAADRDDTASCPREEALCIGRTRGDGSRTGGGADLTLDKMHRELAARDFFVGRSSVNRFLHRCGLT